VIYLCIFNGAGSLIVANGAQNLPNGFGGVP